MPLPAAVFKTSTTLLGVDLPLVGFLGVSALGVLGGVLGLFTLGVTGFLGIGAEVGDVAVLGVLGVLGLGGVGVLLEAEAPLGLNLFLPSPLSASTAFPNKLLATLNLLMSLPPGGVGIVLFTFCATFVGAASAFSPAAVAAVSAAASIIFPAVGLLATSAILLAGVKKSSNPSTGFAAGPNDFLRTSSTGSVSPDHQYLSCSFVGILLFLAALLPAILCLSASSGFVRPSTGL